MKQLPLIPKLLINAILYMFYFIIGSAIAAVIIYGIWGYVFAYSVPKEGDPIFDKIAIAVAVITFIITLVFRKYFYMSLASEEEVKVKHKKTDFSLD